MSEFTDLLSDLQDFTLDLSDAFYDKHLQFTNPDETQTLVLDLSLRLARTPEEIALFPQDFQGAKYLGEFARGQVLPEVLATSPYLDGVLELHALLDVNPASLGTPTLFLWRR